MRQRATSSDGRDGCSTVPPLGVQGGCEGVSWTPATHGSNTPSTVRVRRPIPHQFRPAGVTEAFPEKTLLRTCLCLFSQCPVPDRIDIRMEFLPRSLIPWPALCARLFCSFRRELLLSDSDARFCDCILSDASDACRTHMHHCGTRFCLNTLSEFLLDKSVKGHQEVSKQ